MDTTVRIKGIDYAHCKLCQSGEYWGIETPEMTFWVFPSCDEEGGKINSLPPFLPIAIRSVTTETPDLTREYPETVKELFDQRRSYFSKATLQSYISQYPNESCLTEGQFQEARRKLLDETLEDFARNPRVRQMVWDRHGTRQVANQHGYLGDVWDTEILPDGTERRVSLSCSFATSLAFKIAAARSISLETAWTIVSDLKYVMIYDGVPTRQFIYLREMKAAALGCSPQVPQIHVQATIESRTLNEVQLHWPAGETPLREINHTTKETLATVRQIHGKKQAKDKKWHQKGGRATSKWAGHLTEACKLARVMRQALKHYVRDKGTKRGSVKRACARGRAWWKSSDGFKGTPLESFLDDEKISDANLYRLMQRDFRKNHKAEV